MSARPAFPSLVSALAAVEDQRARRGVRYSLVSVLALACCAMLCGYSTYEAMAQWGRDYGEENPTLCQELGFSRGTTPCAATFFYAFKHIDHPQLEQVLSDWIDRVLVALPPAPEEWEALDIDGKTLRGSARMGAPGAHLLSAFSQRLAVTLGQVAVSDKTNVFTYL